MKLIDSLTRRQWLGGIASTATTLRIGAAYGQSQPPLQNANLITTAGNLELEEVLKEKHYLEDFGIKANTLHVADGNKIMGALVSGGSDIAIATGFNQVFPAIERGAKVKLLAGGIILGQQTVYSSRNAIRRVADLKGATIGVGALGSQLHEIMLALLVKKGVDPKSVRFVNIGSSTDVFKAVTAGAVDAGPGTIDQFENQAKYGVHSLTDGNFWEQLPEYAFQASYASDDAIAKKRDKLVRILAAYCKLYRYVSSPGSEAVFVRGRNLSLGKSDPTTTAASEYQWHFFQKYQIFATNLLLTQEQVRYQQELNVQLGVQKAVLPFDQVADMSLAKEALKLLA